MLYKTLFWNTYENMCDWKFYIFNVKTRPTNCKTNTEMAQHKQV